MAIGQLQIPQSNINNTVDPSAWATLGNLGNVYREAQAARTKQAGLASLGTDPQANMRALLTSGDPTLAQLGLNLQQKQIEQQREDVRYGVTDARANAELAIQQAAARRAQQTFEETEKDRLGSGAAIAPFLPGAIPPGAAPPSAPPPAAPFPAPLPGANPALPPQAPIAPTGQPAAPVPPAAPPGQPIAPPVPGQPVAPSAFEATPRVPAGLQPPAPPPVKAEGGDNEALPGWVQSAQAQPPDMSIVGRITSNLTSGHPAPAAGITRDQIAAAYQNPITRPIAVAFLQKQLDPGTYSFQQVGDKMVRTNSKTGVSDVVMSDTKPIVMKEGETLLQHDPNDPTKMINVTPGGTESKTQRENRQRTEDALSRGFDKTTADYYGLTGKMPKEDLSPTEMKAVSDAEKQVTSGRDVLDNISRLRELSPTAWSGWGASKRASFVNAVLPNEMIPQGAVDTKELSNLALQNVAGQAKAMFGARLAVAEVKLLNQIETTPEMSDQERQRVYTRIERLVQRHVDAASGEAEGIRNKTYFKPGGAAAPAAPAAKGPTWSIEP